MCNSIQSPINQLAEDALVADLIDSDNHCWKRHLINQIFSLDEVRAITSIPISIIDKEDKQIVPCQKWHFLSQECLPFPSFYFH